MSHIVAGTDPAAERVGGSERFIGSVRIGEFEPGTGGLAAVEVKLLRLDPGARTRPHSHDAEQLVCFVGGPGIVAVDGGADERVEPGQLVALAAGVVHMHGAPADAPTTQLSIMPSGHGSDFAASVPAAWRRFAAASDA